MCCYVLKEGNTLCKANVSRSEPLLHYIHKESLLLENISLARSFLEMT